MNIKKSTLKQKYMIDEKYQHLSRNSKKVLKHVVFDNLTIAEIAKKLDFTYQGAKKIFKDLISKNMISSKWIINLRKFGYKNKLIVICKIEDPIVLDKIIKNNNVIKVEYLNILLKIYMLTMVYQESPTLSQYELFLETDIINYYLVNNEFQSLKDSVKQLIK